MRTIHTDHPALVYSGRIDFDDPKAPVFVYAGSFVRFSFTGKQVGVVLSNQRAYFDNSVGYFLDGQPGQFLLPEDNASHEYYLDCDGEGEHTLCLYKRQDGCHYFTLHGILIPDSAEIHLGEPLPSRRIEVFGDSVSCGEVCEALDRVGQQDPENHEGIYSNSWYAYGWITARALDAQVHLTAQGGAALLDHTGWFCSPDYVGLETIYDKIRYNPQLGPMKQWDFAKWQPQVVVFAFGQNDSNPEDYMATDPAGEKAVNWKRAYKNFLCHMMELYPKAFFILGTTTLMHNENWDHAIEQVCREVNSSRVTHLIYRDNGAGTPGHLRIPEHERMAEDLIEHIKSLGDIWNED
ncbi:MAG: electron transporter RnfD [Acetatifactor sp.]